MPSGQLQGEDLFESVTGAALARKEQRCANRCDYCWHDRAQRCMCHSARPHSLHTTVNFKLLVLMHSKEYLNPGTDAKLLLAMLPPERAKLYARLPPSNPARGARARCGAVHAPVSCYLAPLERSSDAYARHSHVRPVSLACAGVRAARRPGGAARGAGHRAGAHAAAVARRGRADRRAAC